MEVKLFAFYLPQFYPFPENDKWWGKGFTEWTNVGKAKKLFPGHYQPRVPADLGYYDLRVPEVREAQAQMAKEYGITAFCYYHYWFGEGKQLLDLPLNEVVKLKKPDFPFFLCWANLPWENKNWNADSQNEKKTVLIEQKYPGLEDAERQFYALLDIFKDERYYRIDGKLAYMIYRTDKLPYVHEYCNRWNELAIQNGLNGFYFMSYIKNPSERFLPYNKDMQAYALCRMDSVFGGRYNNGILRRLSILFRFPIRLSTYKRAIRYLLCEEHKEENVYPVLLPNWDHTPRLGFRSTLYINSTPELWKKLLLKTFNIIKDKKEQNQIVFIKSWNEWGEGNYLEPDLKYGKGYLEAIKDVLSEK